MEKKIKHKSVLLQEVLEVLSPVPGQVFIDSTIGFGGHAQKILKNITKSGKLLGIDQDEEALDWLERNLVPKYPNLTLVKANFSEIKNIAGENGFKNANGILADIGVSSYQLGREERGFSFQADGPLDMRMDKTRDLTAAEVVNTYSEKDLAEIFSKYGEERLSKTIAREIVGRRAKKSLKKTLELAEMVEDIYRKKGLARVKIHPATRVFQALRIEVNDELERLKKFLPGAIEILAPQGRLAIITFHSLEDRIVKDYFSREAKGCICPPDFPTCGCGKKAAIKLITKKPITSSEEEIKDNPRSRSAKLRVIEKLGN
ncbi:16S rRNA (cytosine(1402)-N(4))-methyltransferase RsmH [candidate division WS5 bacterium]|uniref:Ribosomal RNA small subunit methyltransferase H n=1 Tax=candidate division WS5 bacterium TaxID=2093353 RepID=A0A419DA80_9BACT|nr:MAG: 16S rRNA (cytosine(1402)-N(4))-methyltransferase RsmH [candidate division WS5 bacterium]